jgi:hypothetical protein
MNIIYILKLRKLYTKNLKHHEANRKTQRGRRREKTKEE